MKRIKIVENGFEDNPGVIVGKKEKNYAIFESTLFLPNHWLKLSKAQAKKLAKFLEEFSKSK